MKNPTNTAIESADPIKELDRRVTMLSVAVAILTVAVFILSIFLYT